MQHITQPAARPISRPRPSSFGARILHWILEIDRRHRETLQLKRLSDDQLRDIGLNRSELSGL